MTNGEKLIEIFTNSEHISLKRTTQFVINPMTPKQQMIVVDNDFWDAEYKEPVIRDNGVKDELVEPKIENDLGIDCISRADVLQILLDYDYANENALVIKDIKALPSVTPQPRKGHWVDNKCTNCGYEVQPWNNTNYCPNCGADMKEVEE